MTPDQLRATFHTQTRTMPADRGPGRVAEQVGKLFRSYALDPAGWAIVESPGPVTAAQVAEQVAFFAGRGQVFEWKTYDYDPGFLDLVVLLTEVGFERGDDEALMLGELAPLAEQEVALPDGVRIREVDEAADFHRIAAMHATVWGGAWSDRSDEAIARWQENPAAETELVVEESRSGPVLCAARASYDESDFVGMWGGSTLPQWRRRGLYRATLQQRARLGLARGKRFARVDASPDSEPILTSLGLHRVATTVPFEFTP